MSGIWGQSGYQITGASGGTSSSTARIIQFAVGTATATSATQIPAGAVVIDIVVDVGTAYTAGATLAITCGATSLLPAAAINAQVATEYISLVPTTVAATAVVTCTVAGGPVVGAAVVTVVYGVPNP